jgi:hypothetical protein
MIFMHGMQQARSWRNVDGDQGEEVQGHVIQLRGQREAQEAAQEDGRQR